MCSTPFPSYATGCRQWAISGPHLSAGRGKFPFFLHRSSLPSPPHAATPSLSLASPPTPAAAGSRSGRRRRTTATSRGGVARGEGAVAVEVTARERRRWRQGGLLALTARDAPAHPLAASSPLPPPHHRRMGRRCRRLTAVGWVAASGSVGAMGTLRGRSWGIGNSGGGRGVARSPASVRATFPLVGTSSMFSCMAAVGSTSRITTSGDFGLFLDPDGRPRLRPPPRRRSIPMPAPPPRTPPYSTSPPPVRASASCRSRPAAHVLRRFVGEQQPPDTDAECPSRGRPRAGRAQRRPARCSRPARRQGGVTRMCAACAPGAPGGASRPGRWCGGGRRGIFPSPH
jgi:hypothetical protein